MRRRDFLKASLATGALSGFAAPSTVAGASQLPSDPTALDAVTLSHAIHERWLSCREVMTAYLERMDQLNPTYNAIVSRAPDDLCLAMAIEADQALDRGEDRGWLHGIPHLPKDSFDVAGFATSHGSPIHAGRVVDSDEYLMARLRAAGALFVGKTNLPEFGMGSQSYNTVFGTTGSARDPALTAGGSSGGTASALGAHLLAVGDGGDLMGSLRNPAAFNGVVGFRPTQGRVADGGAGDLFYQQMGTSGPMGRNVTDTIHMLGLMAGFDRGEPLSLRDPLPLPSAYRARNPESLRIGWLGDFDGYLATEAGVLDVCEGALARMAAAGAVVEPVRVDFAMDRLWQTWLTLRHWTRHGMRDLYDDPATRAQLKPEAIWEIEGAFGTSAADVHAAGVARADWYRALHAVFDRYDVLALPTAQVFPFDKQVHWPERIGDRPMDTYHRWMEVVIGGTLAGVPVAAVPAGADPEGRPMGVQLLGPFGEDAAVLEVALAWEAVIGTGDAIHGAPPAADTTGAGA